ncbi:hypothetical protein, partial [Pseudomonas fulva]|uniref:hypothetical protein n=1 Tax=Pseudomonas fulva TaxID=47880 RepID=UPI003D9B6E48
CAAMGCAAPPTFPDAKLHTLNRRHILLSLQFAKPFPDSLQTPLSPHTSQARFLTPKFRA